MSNEKKKNNKKKFLIISIFVVVLIVLFTMFSKFKKSEAEKPHYSDYNYLKLEKKSDLGSLHVSGYVTSDNPVGIFVDKRLKVKEVFVKNGDYVNKGDILMTFDDEDKNRLNRSMQKESINAASLTRDLNAAQELYKIGGASLEEITKLKEAIQVSNLNMSELKEELNKTASDIKSPLNGVVGNVKAQQNYLVDTTAPLLDIIDLESLKVTLEIPEYNVTMIKVGQKAVIKPEIFEGKKEFEGTITKISNLSSVSDRNGARVLKADVTLNKKVPELVPGFVVDANILLTSESPELLIPKEAIREESGEKYFVYAIDGENKVIKKYIEVISSSPDNATILNGISEGETIILNPDNKITDGLILSDKGE